MSEELGQSDQLADYERLGPSLSHFKPHVNFRFYHYPTMDSSSDLIRCSHFDNVLKSLDQFLRGNIV